LALRAVAIINQLASPVLAVDLPSGAEADDDSGLAVPRVEADAIVTFTAPKPVHVFGDLTHGPVAVAQIGSPHSAISENSALAQDVVTATDVQAITLPRPRNAHKGDFGHVLVVGGSVGKAGAAAMVGMAALKTGAGLVTIACPKSIQATVAGFAPELMTVPLPETAEGTISLLALAQRESLLQGKSAVVIGPGLSRNPETSEFVRDFVSICSTSVVIDADGINAFAGHMDELHKEPGDVSFRVITPHPGEMATLTGIPVEAIQMERVGAARDAAHKTGVCVVLKGQRTVIASPHGHLWINPTGNPGMAKGGSGDVLAGMMGAFVAARYDVVAGVRSINDPEGRAPNVLKKKHRTVMSADAAHELHGRMKEKTEQAFTLMAALNACRAVYLHGLAGDIAREIYGEASMVATDIIECIAEAMEACAREAHDKFTYLHR
jgi:NAD(P)H-hydrate epimerase